MVTARPNLLTLPAEIREEIYKVLLIAEGEKTELVKYPLPGSVKDTDVETNVRCGRRVTIQHEKREDYRTIDGGQILHTAESKERCDGHKRKHLSPQLLATCKHVYNEALAILYSENCFTSCSCSFQHTLPHLERLSRMTGKNHIVYLELKFKVQNNTKMTSNPNLTVLPRLRRVEGISTGDCTMEERDIVIERVASALIDRHQSLRKIHWRQTMAPPLPHEPSFPLSHLCGGSVKLLADGEDGGTAVRLHAHDMAL